MRIESRGFHLHYLRFGPTDLPAVVLIPGFMQAAEDWVRLGYVDALSENHRVVVVDPLGFGDSDRPHDAEAYRFDGCVTDVSAVLDAEDLDRAVVWGYSRGAILAEAFARQHPERCSAVILGGIVVGLSAADRTNISHPEMDAVLRSGDWGRYFDGVFPFLDAETRELFARRNDPIAAAAVSEAGPYPHAGDGAPLPEVTLTYAGTKEPWFEVAAAVAQSLDVDFAAVPGADHAEAFRAAEMVVSLARTYLDVPAA